MSLWAIVGLAILCAIREAEAERAIVVDAVGAPFAASELATAIRVRVSAEGASIRIRITATVRGVRIDAPGGVREVDLLGLQGPAAARLVALAADDLLPDEMLGVAAAPASSPAVASARAARRDAPTLGVLGAVASWSSTLGDLAVEATIPRGAWLLAFELGGGQLVDGPLHLTTALARVDAGLRAGLLEARIGLTAAPVFVTDGAGDQTALLGANVSLRVRLPLGAALHGLVAVGCDAFATRTTYQLGSMTLATPRFAPWLAAGVEVGL